MEEVSRSGWRCFKSVAAHAEGVENVRHLNLVLDDYMGGNLSDKMNHYRVKCLAVDTSASARPVPPGPQSPLTDRTLARLEAEAEAEAGIRADQAEAAKQVKLKARELSGMNMDHCRYKEVCQELEALRVEAEEKLKLVEAGQTQKVESEKALLILRMVAHYGEKLDERGRAKVGAKLTIQEYGEWTSLSEADRLMQERKKDAKAREEKLAREMEAEVKRKQQI